MQAAPLPKHHAQGDFFICDVFDAAPKDDMASMEHPIFSLSTRPDLRVLRYAHGDTSIEIIPSVKGLATIHDKDILIYCISQLMAAINAGKPVARTLHLTAHDLLAATSRETSGDGYRRLREALERLSGTRIVTNIATGARETTSGFGLIDTWEIVRKTRAGRMISARITLSDWLFRAVLSKSVLTLSRDYFALRKPLERRIYEIARKHCGQQSAWQIGLATLLKKSGSASPLRVFRKMIRDMAAQNHLPDYTLNMQPGDLVRFESRGRVLEGTTPTLAADIHARAREAAPGYDPYFLQAEWQAMWQASGRPVLRSANAAFLAFCRKRAAMQPLR